MKEKNLKYKIVYYSGTGGSAMIANCFDEVLRNNQCSGDVERITFQKSQSTSQYDILLLIFPVYAFNAPEAVYRWIDQVEKVDNIKAAVISISGGGEVSPNTASRQSSIKKLEKKGYNVIYESMLVMPSNIVVATKESLSIMLLDLYPKKVEEIVADLLSGKRIRTTPIFIDRILSVLGEFEKLFTWVWGRRIKVSDDCNGCGWCSNNCPAGNITLSTGKPIFAKKCHLCLGCIYGCPQKALKPGIAKFVVIKEGYDLDILKAKCPNIKKVDLDKEAKGILWSGVKKYLSEL